MKQFLAFLLIVAAAAGGWYARDLIPPKHEDEKAKEEEHAEGQGVEIENGVVKLDEETEERLGIEVSELAEAKREPGIAGVGQVLDPAPLVALDGEITAAAAALDASRAELDRAQKLFQSGENVAKKSVDTAQALFRADEIKLSSLKRRLPLEWGSLIGSLDSSALSDLCEKLARGEAAIVRVEALGDLSAELPAGASIHRLNDASTSIEAERIAPAPSLDSKTQSVAFLLLCRFKEGNSLTPGTMVSAELKIKGEAAKGVIVPRDAIVRQGAQAWVYLEKEEREFTRVPVNLQTRDGEGWFISDEKVPAGAKLVTTGAAALLSAELTAAGAGGGEEEP